MKLFTLATTLLLLSSVGTAAAGSKAAKWNYSGQNGPENWGQLSPEYGLCATGKNQSPLNISDAFKTNLPKLRLNYGGKALKVASTGHGAKIEVREGSTLSIQNESYKLLQTHFHSPSEHTINGKSYPLEAHFVHQAEDGSLAVIGVLYSKGAHNPNLQKVIDAMPRYKKKSKQINAFQVDALMPKKKQYYRYSGSLTTPPCSEGVKWIVLKKTPSISEEQIKKFKKLHRKPTNRPIQPLNARNILR